MVTPAASTVLRDGFRFRGGHPALDLTATLSGRLKHEPRELLLTPRDLERWLAAAGMPAAGADGDDLVLARALREAIHRLALREDEAEARAALNLVAELPGAAPQLDADGGFHWLGAPRQMLATLAQEAVRLFAGHAPRVRQCEGETCAILFLDTSRKGDRRWCSMAGCGNKAKVAEFRRRQRGDARGAKGGTRS